MSINKQLAVHLAVGVAIVTLFGPSAFADSRHSNETRARSERRVQDRTHDRQTPVAQSRGDESRNTARAPQSNIRQRTERTNTSAPQASRAPVTAGGRSQATAQSRERATQNRAGSDRERAGAPSGGRIDVQGRRPVEARRDDRYRDSGRAPAPRAARPEARGNRHNDRYRDSRRDDRYRDSGRNHSRSHVRPQHRQPYHAHGRVTRYERYRSGYRVWLVGAPYPFFVPEAYFHSHRIRVGVAIGLGGYYNPLGYYDYYDGRGYSQGMLRGYVESVDYRRDTFVIRNEATGSFVTVLMRARRYDVREGDYVEVSGDWTRSGYFDARYVDFVDYGYRR